MPLKIISSDRAHTETLPAKKDGFILAGYTKTTADWMSYVSSLFSLSPVFADFTQLQIFWWYVLSVIISSKRP